MLPIYRIPQFALLTLLSVAVVFSPGCEQKTAEEFRAGDGGRNYGGVYRINMVRGNPAGLDPVAINSKLQDDIAQQIFDRLVSFDSNLRTVPEIAHSWSLSEDGTVYSFLLRTDVYFHDNVCFPNGKGRKLTAEDVVYSLTRACDPATRTLSFWAFKNKVVGADKYYEGKLNKTAGVDNISGIRAKNDSVVEIQLLRAYRPFLLTLANGFGCIVPREAVEYYGESFPRNPVGSGAFVFAEWKDDQHIVVKKNHRYWQKDRYGNRLPFLDEIRISFMKDDKVQHNTFVNGKLEESFTIPTEFYESVLDERRRPRTEYQQYNVQARPAMLTWFVSMLCTEKPFANPDVRRAFSCAVDREKIVRYVLRNAPFSAANNGINPPVMPGYPIDSIVGWKYDPATARRYLAKAGFPNGKNFPAITLSVYQEPRLVQVAEALQSMISETLNIPVNIQILQFAELLDRAESGKLQCWGTRWYGDYPDPENYLNLWDGLLVPKNNSEKSYPNDSRYTNSKVNSLLAQAVGTTDDAVRAALYREAEQIAVQEAPSILLFYEMHYRLLQPYVRDYPLDAMARTPLKWAWFHNKK